jgi:hypothetical protein
MHISSLIVGAVILLYVVILGFAIIAFGQLLLAIREIAFNTRKEGVKTPHYEVLLIMAKINNILGWVLIILGLVGGIYMAVAGPGITIAGDLQKTSVL